MKLKQISVFAIAALGGIFIPKDLDKNKKYLFKIYQVYHKFIGMSMVTMQILYLIKNRKNFDELLKTSYVMATGFSITLKYFIYVHRAEKLSLLNEITITGNYRPLDKQEEKIHAHYEKLIS